MKVFELQENVLQQAIILKKNVLSRNSVFRCNVSQIREKVRRLQENKAGQRGHEFKGR
jgi:hypothetical protein